MGCSAFFLFLASLPSDSAIQTRADALLAQPQYQSRLPQAESDPGRAGTNSGELWRTKKRRGQPAVRPGPGPVQISASFSSAVVQTVLLIVTIAVLMLLFSWLFRSRNSRTAAPNLKRGAREPQSEPRSLPPEMLADADELAAQGHFDEAIHVLLLRTIEFLSKRTQGVSEDKTSRELVRQLRLPAPARPALNHLVSTVETSHFGTSRPGAEEYKSCKLAFSHFAKLYQAKP